MVWVILGWNDDESDPDVFVFGNEEAADAFFEKVTEKYAHASYEPCDVYETPDVEELE